MAVYFLNQTFSENKCLNCQLMKNAMSKQCVVYLEKIYNLKKILCIS